LHTVTMNGTFTSTPVINDTLLPTVTIESTCLLLL
jgi:hypothetical protein